MDAEQVVRLYTERKKHIEPVHKLGATLRRVYNGEYDLTLPELTRHERASVANLIQNGIDAYGDRIGSVLPVINCPPMKTGRAARRRAESQQRVLQAWWYHNGMTRKVMRRARHLVGLATAPVLIRPHSDGIPHWEIKDPLATYPAPGDPDDLVPSDCIFAFERTWKWLSDNYDVTGLGTGDPMNLKPDTMFTVLQYTDDTTHMLVARGRDSGMRQGVPKILSQTDNRAGCPLVVIPGRITMDRLQGQFDQMIGMYELESELWALQLHAVKRGIFAETYIVSANPMEEPEFDPANPYTGEVGKVLGGDIKQFRTDPGFQTINAINQLEANQRIAGSVPAEMGGESPSNVRTGRRGQQVFSATVDFPIKHAQELLAASLEKENDVAIAVDRAYYSSRTRTLNTPRGRGPVTYTSSIFDDNCQYVSYSYAGADTNGLVIEAGQRIGMGTFSKQSFMAIDPLIDDPDAEHDRVVSEAIEAAFLNHLQQQAADPQSPWQPRDFADFAKLVFDDNIDIYEATQRVDDALKAKQAAAQQGQLGAADMQPGLAPPGAPGTPQAGAAIQPPGPSQQNLMQLLTSLRRPQARTPAEVGAPGRQAVEPGA